MLGAAGVWMLRPDPSAAPKPVVRFTVPVPGGHELLDFYPNIAVSPDGMTLAYFAGNQLVLHSLERGVADARSLDDLSVARCCLAFSPDGRWVLFGSSGDRGELWGAPTAGGPIVDFWSRPVEQALVHATWDEGIWMRRAGDETWIQVTTLDGAAGDGAHLWPQLLAEGRYLLYTIMGPGMMWNGASVVLKDLNGGEQTTIATSATHGRYVPTGHVVYIRANGTVEAVPFDLERQEVTGDPILVEEGVRTAYWGGAASFAVSDAGTFAFVRGSSWRLHQLTWVDRRGNVLDRVGTPITVEGIKLSPDGRYGVTYVASPNADIARFELATGEQRRLTFDPTTEDNPIWSPDGRRIAYRRTVAGRDQRILAIPADGTGAPEELFAAEHTALPRDWSPDGSAILLNAGEPLVVLELASGRVDTLTRGRSWGGSFSPDGRWIAYSSDETGRFEVYIVGYPGLTGKQQLSQNGGRRPEWSAARSEVFFVNQDTMMVTQISTSPRVEWTTPEPLFTVPDLVGLVNIGFGVSPDGQRILYPARNPEAPAREIHVVVNWFEELRRRSDDSED